MRSFGNGWIGPSRSRPSRSPAPSKSRPGPPSSLGTTYSSCCSGGGRIVGSSGLHRIDWSVPSFEIGYWVRTPDSGQGYATEAVEAIGSFAFEKLGARRIEIRADTRNTRSRAIPEKLGYQLEGVLRHDCLHVDGRLRDTAVYARIR